MKTTDLVVSSYLFCFIDIKILKIDGISLDEALKEIFISGSLGNVFVKLKSFKRNTFRLDVLLHSSHDRKTNTLRNLNDMIGVK
jgi:hypothetical protein